MWGDPHISVGRRVERPIQCRKGAEASQADETLGVLELDAGDWPLLSKRRQPRDMVSLQRISLSGAFQAGVTPRDTVYNS